MPKPSVTMSAVGICMAIPCTKARLKVAVMGPDATPPASKAIPTNRSGTKNASTTALPKPANRYIQSLISGMRVRSVAISTASPTARERKISTSGRLTWPPVTSSTWCVSTITAGSASTVTSPSRNDTISTGAMLSIPARVLPTCRPTCMKPPLTPVRNNTNPVYAISNPMMIPDTRRFDSLKEKI